MSLELRCPYCNKPFVLDQKFLKVRYMRHARFKQNKLLLNPNLDEELVRFFLKKNLIIGCGKIYEIQKKTYPNGLFSFKAVKI
tara:strand:+ start:57 stop:305 length:249 start_codon:yes stop_codon:yes gene_type:complete